jgi:acyl-CoA thioester hydrolase
MITSRATVTVRYAETDMMGFAYHGSYLPWFEIGRTGLLKEHGLPYRELEAAGYFLPVIEMGARYLRSARYDDPLEITTLLRDKPVARIRLDYEVRAGAQLLATGFTIHAFIDRAGRPTRPPINFAEKMATLFKPTLGSEGE